MFENKEIACHINEVMLKVSSLLDESVALVAASNCHDEEKVKYYNIVGQIMGIIGIDVLNNIYRIHSDIKPSDYFLPEDYKQCER